MPTAQELVITDGNAIMVRWVDLTIEGIDRVEQQTKSLATRHGSVHYYAVVPNGAGLPPDDIRRRMQESLKAFQSYCETINLVFDGTGMKAAAARSIAASIFLISGNRKMHMHSSLDEAFIKTQPDRAPILADKARGAGIA